MDIRRARADDVPQLLTLIRRYWEFEGIRGFAALRIELMLEELIAHPGERGLVWVAESERTLRGYLIAVVLMSIEHQGLMGEVDEFFLMPEARCQGVGARLLAATEADLVQHGCVRVQLQLALGNSRGRSFYARQGYAPRAGYALLDKTLR